MGRRQGEYTEERYRFMFECNPQPMWIIDRESMTFLEVNRAAVDHFGYTRSELLNMRLPQLDFAMVNVSGLPALPPGGKLDGYRTLHCKDGSEVHIEVNARDVVLENRSAVLASLTDVTELINARRSADEANQAKSRFLANMSHEIRTPLGAILGFAELMADPRQSESERQDCIKTILRNGSQLSTVINDILDLSKIESERLSIESLPVCPIEVLEDVADLLRVQARAKGIDLILRSDSALPLRICSDPTRLRQILINIIGNALKFTKQGRVEVRVRQSSEQGIEFLKVLVKDDGPGISIENRAKLFQPFMQADTSTARVYGGSGLGLLLSRRLANALGGDVQLLESEVGQGSTFEISVAIGTQKDLDRLAEGVRTGSLDEASCQSEKISTFDDASLIGLHILLAEDAPDNRVLVSRLLAKEGAQVSWVDNGEDAVQQTLRGHFDVVLMDIQMPRMDGLHAVEFLRSKNYAGAVVALTAHAMNGDREKCLSAGFDDYVMKPIDRRALVETLSRVRSQAAKPAPRFAFENAT